MPQKIKTALVMGTRPEAIKLAPLYLRLQREPDRFSPQIWATGQHREMLAQALATFRLQPHRDFDIMRRGQSLTDVTMAVLQCMRAALEEERPDVMLVQGDTTTVFAAALAAFYARVPVGHVEAGLRTWNRHSPYPEECNRQMTSVLADLHFAPTTTAKENLAALRIPGERIWVTGNTVIDALDIVVNNVRATRPALPDSFPLQRLADGHRMVLITGHRRENFGVGFESICTAILTLARRHPDCEFVYPVHLNPNVREPVLRILNGLDNVHLTEPLPYESFVWAMDRAHFLLSDSGGIQEEAPHLGKPVLVMRDTTERPEAVEAGTARLVGTNCDTIVNECAQLLDDPASYAAMSHAVNPFGDGRACDRIAAALKDTLPL